MKTHHRRKKTLEDAHNNERWMVSYADFVTLLFAFFVVMYSISSINEGKYKTISNALAGAFSIVEGSGTSPNPIDLGNPAIVEPVVKPENNPEIEKKRELSEAILKERENLQKAANQLEKDLSPFVEDKLVAVKRQDYWVELEMNSELLFSSGQAELSKKALPAIEKVMEVISKLPNPILVEGHTDNVPIDNIIFRSNWDLSSARATSVVHEFVRAGLDPTRLSAVGYGEFHPIADNATEEGRFKNRRVAIVLMSHAFSRYGANDEERAKLLNLAPTLPSDTKP